MMRFSIERRPRKYVKRYGFLLLARKYKKKSMHIGLDSLKTTFKKVVLKTIEFLG